MPKVLQWFTGNIDLHHIHHLNPRIPNCRLQSCRDDEPALGTASGLTVRESL
jgi:omega-6 fatty acid desaturase (delta-12 desaturase)